MDKTISPELRELFVAYNQFTEAALQYIAGQGAFRPRSKERALLALQEAMQYALKRLLVVAVLARGEDWIELQLPAVGRQGRVLDIPRYVITEGPGIAQLRYQERIPISQPALSLRVHRVDLDEAGQGLAPLFGDLLPFTLDFSLS